MNPAYLLRLEQSYLAALALETDRERVEFLERLAAEDAALADETRMLVSLRNEAEDLFSSRDGDFFQLSLSTLGDAKRLESKAELLDFLRAVSAPLVPAGSAANRIDAATSDGQEIASIQGFVLTELVAAGATGFVFRGRDPKLRREVAIKVLAPSIARDPVRRRAFVEEARIASSIRHPHVVTIHHVCSDESSPVVFYVMEWASGITLQEWIDDRKSVDIAEGVTLLRQLAAGVDAIHRCGVIHRDLKPANVILEVTNRHVTIVDFGLAFETSVLEDYLHPAGTPLYMSPEQMSGQPLTSKSDLFALTEIAALLLTGCHPYASGTLAELTERLLAGTPCLPDVGPVLSESLRKALLQGLASDPGDRYSDAGALINAVANALGEDNAARRGAATDPDRANGIAPVVSSAKVSRRREVRWGSALLALTLVGALIVAFTLPRLGRNVSEGGKVKLSPQRGDSERAKGRWESPELFRNGAGLRLRAIPDFKRAFEKWPPDSRYPELFRGLGWPNMPGGTPKRLIGPQLVSYREFRDVTGGLPAELMAGSENLDLPATNVTYRDAEEFCRQLTAADPDGIVYLVSNLNDWTIGAFGDAIVNRQVDAERLVDAFLARSRSRTGGGISTGSRGEGAAGRIADIHQSMLVDTFGNYWEWMQFRLARQSKSPRPDGVVSYQKNLESCPVRILEVVGGGATDIFLHAHDMNYGMNDHLEQYENVRFHLEGDGETGYLRPETAGRPAWLSYRYQLKKPIVTARLRNPIKLFKDECSAAIEVRGRKAEASTKLEDSPWHTVVEIRGPYDQPFAEMDATQWLRDAIEVEVRYRVETSSGPLNYVQIGRTNSELHLPVVFAFEAVTMGREESMRQSLEIPETHRSPLIGFRVVGFWPSR
ncbi:MAG: protein kinase domain-containing protein [Planctomycetota bacterium]